MTTCVLHANSRIPVYPDSPQVQEGKFRNVVPTPPMGFLKTVRLAWNVLTNKPRDTVPDRAIPVQALTRAELMAAPDRS
ncbi:MAG: hydrolase, partial [Pseudoxanthomonas sp.]